MQNKTDAELMQFIQAQHRPALEELYDRYIKLIYSFILKSTRDHEKTRIIVQLVFTRLWTTKNGYNPEKGQFVNWLLTITRNITIDYHRKEKRDNALTSLTTGHLEYIADTSGNGPEDNLSRKLIREQVQKAYQYLSKSQIDLIQCLYWEGYTLREIAEMNKEPIGTIKSRLHQALKILRNHIVLEMGE